ncbi:hypothetical protein [Nostoc sp.]|uniref:hypothetical protein n=1 Tax=Nostoc sp. TaxID=1180 RepID=UPI002FF924E8
MKSRIKISVDAKRLAAGIARQIVEETHNGRLSCNSVLGEGTEFVIEIPVF